MNDTENLKIEYLDIDSIKPYENNARRHEDKDVDKIVNSIKEFGMCDPIGIWSDNNVIVEGHGRLLALKRLGFKRVPVIRLDHLTDEQRRMYALTHNKTAELSDWDDEFLASELGDLKFDFDIESFGFNEGDFNLESIEMDYDDELPELKEHNSNEKEITCPHCGGKILL